MDNTINVVMHTDDAYTPLTAVAVRSLVSSFVASSSSARYHLRVYMITLGVSQKHRSLLEGAIRSVSESVEVFFAPQPLRATRGAEHYIEVLSLKFRFPELLPDVNRVLFLDSDVLVLGDITELWEIDIGDHWIGVAECILVKDPIALRNYNSLFKFKFHEATQPINVGVLILDLERMRSTNVSQRLLKWQGENRDILVIPDQEPIAAVFPSKYHPLPPEWNYRPLAEPFWSGSWRNYVSVYAGLKPKVVHFQAPMRPDKYLAAMPYFDAWDLHYKSLEPILKLERTPLPISIFAYVRFFRVVATFAKLIRSHITRTKVAAVLLMPLLLISYARYRKNPSEYTFTVTKLVQKSSPGV